MGRASKMPLHDHRHLGPARAGGSDANSGARRACPRRFPRLLALAAAALLAAAGCGGGGGGGGAQGGGHASAKPPPPRPAAKTFSATLQAPTHMPKANRPWPITIRATGPNGKPLKGTVSYEFLSGGSVVAHRSHYRFNGTFHDKTITWPAQAVGNPLTFRAVVTTPLGTKNLDYPVQVQR